MPSVFSRIIDGELPARFVWKDDLCVAFLSNRPLRMGHTLVVPRRQVDHWTDLEAELRDHLFATAQRLGRAVKDAFGAARAGLVIAGLEVPHCHLHVVPVDRLSDLDFSRQDPNPDPAEMDQAAAAIQSALQQLGYVEAGGE